jgi:hypothetical protein
MKQRSFYQETGNNKISQQYYEAAPTFAQHKKETGYPTLESFFCWNL